MRLYSGKISGIADEVIRNLETAGDIEVENENEARLDIEAVLKEYLRNDRQLSDDAKQRMEMRGLGFTNLARMKSQVAKERGLPSGEDIIPYLLDQILNMLFHSSNIAEVYANDGELRRKITAVLRKNMDVDSELDANVRSKIKNLEEGTSSFEIEYARVMAEMKRKKGLTD